MLSPTSAFLRCIGIAIITASLSYLPHKAQAQQSLSANMTVSLHSWYNPPDANPPYTAFTPGNMNLNVDYTVLAEADAHDPTVMLTAIDLFATERDYYTGFQTVPLNGGNAKYSVYVTGSSAGQAWTVVNQAYGCYSWYAKSYNDGGEYAQSGSWGGYGNGG